MIEQTLPDDIRALSNSQERAIFKRLVTNLKPRTGGFAPSAVRAAFL